MPNEDQPTGVPVNGGLRGEDEGPDVARQYMENAERWKERAKASGPSRPERGLRFQFGGSFDFSF